MGNKKKTIEVKFDINGVATCIGKSCFWFTTHYWWGKKELKKPVVRCSAKTCPLDEKSTGDVNKEFKKRFPIEYLNSTKKPIRK